MRITASTPSGTRILYNPADAASLGLPAVDPGTGGDPSLPPVDPPVEPIVTPEPPVDVSEPPTDAPESTPPDDPWAPPSQEPLPGGGYSPDPSSDSTPYVDPSFDAEPPSWLFGRVDGGEG